MGLDCSHGAFSGAYSAFNRLRQAVAEAVGGSYPPHWVYGPGGTPCYDESGMAKLKPDTDRAMVHLPDGFIEDYPGITAFLAHSDCDGEIDPATCTVVANELEAILPAVDGLRWREAGHILYAGGYRAALERFIAGCREAAAHNESLRFG